MNACHHHQGSWFKECIRVFPKGTVWHRQIEQLRPRYRVKGPIYNVDPRKGSESLMPLENLVLVETPKEQGDSEVEEQES